MNFFKNEGEARDGERDISRKKIYLSFTYLASKCS
jgi:hypothetical protein